MLVLHLSAFIKARLKSSPSLTPTLAELVGKPVGDNVCSLEGPQI